VLEPPAKSFERAEVTVTNAAHWAPLALELASALRAGLTVVGDPTGQPTDPDQVAVIVDPAWWALQPRELADALRSGHAADGVAKSDNRSSGAITSKGERLTLTVEEAAVVLGISRASAYEATRRGEIPCIRIGRRILVPRVALNRLLAAAGGDSPPSNDP